MKRKIYLCPKCGRAMGFSPIPEYTFYCNDCDEDFYSFEAKEMEQPRMEGIVDYTELVKASIVVKEITESTIQENIKFIKIKGNDVLEQISEYIHETLKPILSTDIWKESNFQSHACMYNGRFRLQFHDCFVDGKEYNVRLMIGENNFYYESERELAYFNVDEYHINDVSIERIPFIVEHWSGLKDSINRMIPYAIEECNKANQKRLEKQKEVSEIINSFRL